MTASLFVVAALVVNLYPYGADSATEILVALHLPVVLWFAVAYPYMGGTIRSHERRMDFVRFTGEWFIYYVLIALGGGVLMGLTAAILEPTGVDVDRVAAWVLPSGAAGAVIVAAWLVESKQRVVENMAPVLAMLFTPLFAVMLAGAAVVYAVTGLGGAFDRELLGVFDALLLVVLGLVLYGMSARDPSPSPDWMDAIQLVAVVSALALDVMVLGSMIARIGELGLSPNRTAALGLNLVLLVNLAGAAWLSARFLMRRSSLQRLERWQTTYLPVFALWAATVVVVLPPLFGFCTCRDSSQYAHRTLTLSHASRSLSDPRSAAAPDGFRGDQVDHDRRRHGVRTGRCSKESVTGWPRAPAALRRMVSCLSLITSSTGWRGRARSDRRHHHHRGDRDRDRLLAAQIADKSEAADGMGARRTIAGKRSPSTTGIIFLHAATHSRRWHRLMTLATILQRLLVIAADHRLESALHHRHPSCSCSCGHHQHRAVGQRPARGCPGRSPRHADVPRLRRPRPSWR